MQKVLRRLFKNVKSELGVLFLISCFYLSVNILFNFQIWKQVVLPEPANVFLVQGESPIYEYIAETVRQNILRGENPFQPTQNALYPVGLNFTLDDLAPVNGFYFILLRPFLTAHQSLMLITVVSILSANIGMYLLLRLIGVGFRTAFLFGLVFGFTPFISLRVGGHPSYTAIYLFPWIAIFFLQILQSKSQLARILSAIGLGFAQVVTVLTNLYFALMVFILCVFFFLFFTFYQKKQFFKFVKSQTKYLAISVSLAVVLLFPWLSKVYEIFIFRQYTPPPSWVDSIAFSADLFGIFLPSYLNPFYNPLLTLLASKIFYIRTVFENFVYPGIIILAAYLFFIIFHKKLPLPIVKKIMPLFFVSLGFWVLTLGPFLHIFGRLFPLPLPYALLNLTPYLQMARAPGRFVVPLVFLASIVTAIIVNNFLENKKLVWKNLLFLGLILIFFLDQSYFSTVPPQKAIPLKIYNHLASEKPGPLFEIPFVIRDGVDYLGDIHAVWLLRVQLIHKQPVFSAYFGRINENVFTYYKGNSLLGPLGKLVDRSTVDLSEVANNFDFSKMAESAEFFRIDKVILKKDERYSEIARSAIEKLGFKTVLDEAGYSLFQKEKTMREFTQLSLGSENDSLFLLQGWSVREEKARWTEGKIAQVMFSVNNVRPMRLLFTAQTIYKPQPVKVYLNNQYIGRVVLGTEVLADYVFDVDSKLMRPGVNILTFRFSNTRQLAKIKPGEKDTRDLSAYFTRILLETR